MKNEEKFYYTSEEKEEFAKQYERIKPLYNNLCIEISRIVSHIASNNDPVIKVANISFRVKNTESFKEKLDRKPYSSPFVQINDFAGIRLVVYKASDIPLIEQKLINEFEVHEMVDKTDSLGTSFMGYGGIHIIVSLGRKYGGVIHDAINLLRCEIQIRTVLQDAWSTISHELAYKSKLAIPDKLLRDFNNLSSLLEVADRNFEIIIEKKEQIKRESEEFSTMTDFFSHDINVEILSVYAKKKFPYLPISDSWQEQLTADLMEIGKYKTIGEIDEIVNQAHAANERYKKDRPDLYIYSSDYITKSLGFISKEFRDIHPFATQTLDAFQKYKRLIKNHTTNRSTGLATARR